MPTAIWDWMAMESVSEGQDYNEGSDPCNPQLRGIDSFNPMDPTVNMAAMGGGTCVGTGPGSANVLWWNIFAVKTTGRCVDDMVVKDPVAMKCAFGENPKRCYKGRGNEVRMATAVPFERDAVKASDYKERKRGSRR